MRRRPPHDDDDEDLWLAEQQLEATCRNYVGARGKPDRLRSTIVPEKQPTLTSPLLQSNNNNNNNNNNNEIEEEEEVEQSF